MIVGYFKSRVNRNAFQPKMSPQAEQNKNKKPFNQTNPMGYGIMASS